MDPVTLATLTSGATVLALEVTKGVASEVGKSAWERIRSLLGWSKVPADANLSLDIARALEADQALAGQVVEILKAQQTGTPSTLVGSLSVEKGSVTVVGTNTGTISNTNTFN